MLIVEFFIAIMVSYKTQKSVLSTPLAFGGLRHSYDIEVVTGKEKIILIELERSPNFGTGSDITYFPQTHSINTLIQYQYIRS